MASKIMDKEKIMHPTIITIKLIREIMGNKM
jgi:hypothetical protein